MEELGALCAPILIFMIVMVLMETVVRIAGSLQIPTTSLPPVFETSMSDSEEPFDMDEVTIRIRLRGRDAERLERVRNQLGLSSYEETINAVLLSHERLLSMLRDVRVEPER